MWRVPTIRELTSPVGPLTSAAIVERDPLTAPRGNVIWSSSLNARAFGNGLPWVLGKDATFG